MEHDAQFYKTLFKGLKEFTNTSFPKKCANCGRIFTSAEQFLSETQSTNTSTSGLNNRKTTTVPQ